MRKQWYKRYEKSPNSGVKTFTWVRRFSW